MQEKFIVPKSEKEFRERARETSRRGAIAVSQGLQVKLNKVKPIIDEKQFYDDIAEFHLNGTIPERYSNDNGNNT